MGDVWKGITGGTTYVMGRERSGTPESEVAEVAVPRHAAAEPRQLRRWGEAAPRGKTPGDRDWTGWTERFGIGSGLAERRLPHRHRRGRPMGTTRQAWASGTIRRRPRRSAAIASYPCWTAEERTTGTHEGRIGVDHVARSVYYWVVNAAAKRASRGGRGLSRVLWGERSPSPRRHMRADKPIISSGRRWATTAMARV